MELEVVPKPPTQVLEIVHSLLFSTMRQIVIDSRYEPSVGVQGLPGGFQTFSCGEPEGTYIKSFRDLRNVTTPGRLVGTQLLDLLLFNSYSPRQLSLTYPLLLQH